MPGSPSTSRSEGAAHRYTIVAVVLHWLVAAMVIGQFSWGWLMQEIPKQPPGLRAEFDAWERASDEAWAQIDQWEREERS